MRPINLIVIHCAATPNGKPFAVEDIDKWHKARGFACIGYHKVIYLDGSVHDGRPIAQIGAHASGYNGKSVGVCMIGTDKFTVKQWDALKSVVSELQAAYPAIALIVGHRDLPKVHKECPGFSVFEWKQNDMEPLDGHIFEEA